MYLSTLGGLQDCRSGLGCSLNMASRSSLERQRFICLSKYFFIVVGARNVPSLDFTRDAGLNPSLSSSSESVADPCFWCLGWDSASSPLLEDGPPLEADDLFLLRELEVGMGPPDEAVDPFLLLVAGPPDEAVDPLQPLSGPSWETVDRGRLFFFLDDGGCSAVC